MNTIGYRTKKNEDWLTSETWKQIEERENIKLRMIKTKSIRMQEQLKAAYATKHNGVKRRARRDRIIFVDNLELEAEQTASHGEMSTVYKITKQLCGKTTHQSPRIKDTNVNPLSTEHEQAKRWVQCFQDVLNCPEPSEPAPSEPASPNPAEEDLYINIETPTIEEIKYAIKTLTMVNHKE